MRDWPRPALAKYYLKNKYGLSVDDYTRLRERQAFMCAICSISESDLVMNPARRDRRLQVDHCHRTGTVRGLLCGDCNRGLGQFKDNPELLEAAAAFLRAQVAQIEPVQKLEELGNG